MISLKLQNNLTILPLAHAKLKLPGMLAQESRRGGKHCLPYIKGEILVL